VYTHTHIHKYIYISNIKLRNHVFTPAGASRKHFNACNLTFYDFSLISYAMGQ